MSQVEAKRLQGGVITTITQDGPLGTYGVADAARITKEAFVKERRVARIIGMAATLSLAVNSAALQRGSVSEIIIGATGLIGFAGLAAAWKQMNTVDLMRDARDSVIELLNNTTLEETVVSSRPDQII